MRATNKVIVQMGLLSIPNVKMYSAIDSGEKVSFNQLHHECHGKLQQKLYCPACDHTITDKKAEVIKGYPQGKDEWVIMSEEEIASCKKDSTDVLKIIQFVGNDDIPAIYHESASYLAPEKDSSGTFGLLYHLLLTMNRTALAKMVMRSKDHFLAIKPFDGVLVAYDLHFPNEIRDTKEISVPDMGKDFDNDTIHLAKQLVDKMSKPFDPSAIHDEYTEALKGIIMAKADGKLIPIAEARQERKAVSVMDALKESLKEAVNF